MIATLDNPASVWQRIFDNLPSIARHILLAMLSLPSEVFLEDLRVAVRTLSNDALDPGEFRSALEMVEGTFLEISEAGSRRARLGKTRRIVTIRDPSVRDYLWNRLEGVDGESELLLGGAAFFEQCVVLYEGQNHAISIADSQDEQTVHGSRGRVVVNSDVVVTKALGLINSDSALVSRVTGANGYYWIRDSPNLERRSAFLIAVLAKNQTSRVVVAAARFGLKLCQNEWRAGRGSSEEGLVLLRAAKEAAMVLGSGRFKAAAQAFVSLITERFDQIEDFTALVEVCDLCPSCSGRQIEVSIHGRRNFENLLAMRKAGYCTTWRTLICLIRRLTRSAP